MPASWFASWRCYIKVSKGCSRYIHINTHTQHDTHIWEMLIVLFPLSPFFRGRRQGRQPLNPAMPRRVVVAAKHSFSYPGARPCRRPSPKILQPAGVFTFLGVRGGKKEGKIWRCVLEVLVGRFLVVFWPIFHNFLVLSSRKNREFTLFLCLWHPKKASDNMQETA